MEATPSGLTNSSRVLASLNGQEHVSDTALHQVKSYGFFVHPGGAIVTTLELDPNLNSGDLNYLDGEELTGEVEYIIPGILSIQLSAGGVSLFKTGE